MTYEDDLQLVGKLIRQDQEAFRAFFDDYFPRLYRFVLRRLQGDSEAARDVAQAALIKAVRHLESYRGEASLFTWICQIGRHALSDYLARNRRQEIYVRRLVDLEDDPQTRAILESIPASAETEPENQRERDDVASLVHAALDYLPHRYAQVLEMKYLEDLPVESIAERLGVTAIAVQSLLARARTAFREASSSLLPSLGRNDPRGESVFGAQGAKP
ncbi:MAG: sigma-70 family RNA polymerase sigma factor [Gammaproteobacteria bacterium]|nr:sigma-70 family RNA polymerase sigma factor [Gammaproteobacteria bacterium]